VSIDIESVLYDLHIVVHHVIEDELWAVCPMHLVRTGKADTHPSWSINRNTLAHHCFSCGYSGGLNGLYEDVSGTVPEDLEWEIQKAGLLASVDNSAVPRTTSTTGGSDGFLPFSAGPPVNEWELGRYAEVPERLLELRHLKRSAVDAFGIRWDRDRKAWVLPMRTPDGTLMGWQCRQKGTFLNHPEGIAKSETLFGLHHQRDESRMAIVESPLDAVRLFGLGIPAVSTMGAWVSKAQVKLLKYHFWLIVSAMDNDAAGRNANERLLRSFHGYDTVLFVFDYDGLPGKDPGDVEDDDLLQAAWDRTLSFGL